MHADVYECVRECMHVCVLLIRVLACYNVVFCLVVTVMVSVVCHAGPS